MNYHNITTCDMKNGDGLRTVLWVSGCNHHCSECHNPQTWDPNSGILFDDSARAELFNDLDLSYISGLTISGGDPLYPPNRSTILELCKEIKEIYSNKTIWIYTGYEWEDIKNLELMKYIDTIVVGPYKKELRDVTYPWAGSSNQRVINVKQSLYHHKVILQQTYNK